MKKLLVIVLLLADVSAFAAGPLEKDTRYSTPIQGFAPNGLLSALLTVNSTTVNASDFLAISIYTPVAAKVRFMATTSKTGSVSHTLSADQRTTFVVNRTTPFVNISGATGGDYMAQ